MRKVELVVYHYTEIDKVVIPENAVQVYWVGDEEGPELHVYLPSEGTNNAKEETEVSEFDIC